jgi:CHAT domain-containing protein/Tfp pilus assembly protein PilF
MLAVITILGLGLVVESIETGTPAHAAGLRRGDVLVSWRPAGEGKGRPLVSPFDLARVEIEAAPRGPVVLVGSRGGQPLEVRVHHGEWRVETRPELEGRDAELHARGEAGWLDLAEAAAARGDWTLACWLTVKMAERAPVEPAGELDPFALAADTCASTARADLIALAQQALARAWQHRRRYPEAEAAWREALRQWEVEAPPGLAVAGVHHSLGLLSSERGLLDEAETNARRALDLRQALAPEGLEVAATLNQLGQISYYRADFSSGSALHVRALGIRRRLTPDSLLVAESSLNLATIVKFLGRLEEAQELTLRALAIASSAEPGGPMVGAIELDLGTASWLRGDMATAESHYRQSLAVGERLASAVLVARSLNNLGNVAAARGDWDAAEVFYQRSLALCWRHWPEGLLTAGVLANLGEVLVEQGRLAEASTIYDEALSVGEKAGPRSSTVAFILQNAAEVSKARGDQAAFAAQVERVLQLTEDPAWTNPALDISYGLKGEVALNQGKLVEAEEWFRKSIALAERFHPGDDRLALAHHRLAKLHRQQGGTSEATEGYRRAVEALEEQRFRLGGTGRGRLGYGVRHAQVYQEAVETLLEAGRREEAFHYWERSRARALLEMLAERDLLLDAEEPLELRQRRRSLEAEYQRTQAALASTGRGEKQDQLVARLQRLRVERQEASQANRASPRLASFAYPQPLNLEQARQALDSGTALIGYSVGVQKTVLFVLPPGSPSGKGVEVETVVIPVGLEALRARIAAWRRLAEKSAPPPAFFAEARALYDLLIRPVERHLLSARRLVLCPDGPLHRLPFAALRRDGAFLTEWKPLALVPSASVLTQLAQPRPASPGTPRLVAFGDPRAPRLSTLAGGRQEVAAIASLFPGAEVHLGEEATEERVKVVGKGVRYLHFAAHGLIDERLPLESSLAFTPAQAETGGDDGLLHAWEIFERMRLDADLVTLSACYSAGGAELAGEGVLGLTRAFQYAGARSVLASLWRVPDVSTTPFMKRFYGGLKGGLAKDEALRRAQLASIRAGHHPLRWASFQLYGDWR